MCVKEYEKEANEIEGEGGGEDEVGVGELVGLLEAWSYFDCVYITTNCFFAFGSDGGVVDEGNGCDER